MTESIFPNLIVILGPTASGKTTLAVDLARWLDSHHGVTSEILSADSRQVYRGMDLGTGKDREEFTKGGKPIPCHLIDLVDPDYEFNLFEYQRAFYRVFDDIRKRGVLPVLVGGTGLYIEAVTKKYDLPEALGESAESRIEELMGFGMDFLRKRFFELRNEPPHNVTDLEEKTRLVRAIVIEEQRLSHSGGRRSDDAALTPFIVGIRAERTLLRRLIRRRLLDRIERGLIDEVKNLYEGGISWRRLDSLGLEYSYVSRHLQGELSRGDMVEMLSVKIGQFAKRQETWFRRMERRGALIHWIDLGDFNALRVLVERQLFGADSHD